MDEIEWIKGIKKVCMIYWCVFFILFLAISGMVLISGMMSTDDLKDICKNLSEMQLMIIGPSIIIVSIYAFIFIVERIINSGKRVINFDKGYIRELPRHCSPSIVSLIYDLKIEVYKDYTAILLYLCTKKYINLIRSKEKVELVKGEENDYSKLSRCEKYILDVILNNKEFNENRFKQEIIAEAKEKELITDKKDKKVIKMLCIIAISLFIMVMCRIDIITCIIYFGIICIIVLVVQPALKENENFKYTRTKDGKNIAILLNGLKRYIKEYTLIKDKEIDYVQILENYIPYALALGEADIVEEFIKYNEEYRDLIYNRRSI